MSQSCSLQYRTAFDAIQAHGRQLLKAAERLREEDVEAVHDARVASRRLRAALAEYKKLFDKKALQTLRDKVHRITSELGTARELDVCIEHLEILDMENESQGQAAKHAVQFLHEKRALESAKLMEAFQLLTSDEFKQDLEAMKPLEKKSSRCFFATASRGALKRFDDLNNAAKAWKESGTPETLHALRIAFKKLRYACEIYKPIYGSSMDGFISSLKDAQDAIGHWHDYSVLSGYLKEAGEQGPKNLKKGYATLGAHVDRILNSSLDLFTRHAEVFFYPEQMTRVRRFLSGRDVEL